jgi:hypothetical protein
MRFFARMSGLHKQICDASEASLSRVPKKNIPLPALRESSRGKYISSVVAVVV